MKDHHTGDNKQQWESRDGDVTKGGYSLAEHDRSIKREQVFVSGHHGCVFYQKNNIISNDVILLLKIHNYYIFMYFFCSF